MIDAKLKTELNAVNDAVRDNPDAKVILQADNIVVVNKDEVSPTFTKLAEADVLGDDVEPEPEPEVPEPDPEPEV